MITKENKRVSLDWQECTTMPSWLSCVDYVVLNVLMARRSAADKVSGALCTMHWLKFNFFGVGQYIPLFCFFSFLTWCNSYFFFSSIFFFVQTDWSLSRSSWPLNLSCVPQMPCSSLPFSCLTRPAQETSHLVTCLLFNTKACMLQRRCMLSSTAGGRASCNDYALISKTTVLGSDVHTHAHLDVSVSLQNSRPDFSS